MAAARYCFSLLCDERVADFYFGVAGPHSGWFLSDGCSKGGCCTVSSQLFTLQLLVSWRVVFFALKFIASSKVAGYHIHIRF
jgi:hypothetical protein